MCIINYFFDYKFLSFEPNTAEVVIELIAVCARLDGTYLHMLKVKTFTESAFCH